jgi:hypothetical protein
MKVNGEVVAAGQIPISAAIAFTANDCLDIGIALGSPVSLGYNDKARLYSLRKNSCFKGYGLQPVRKSLKHERL